MHAVFPSDEIKQELARDFSNYLTYSIRKLPLQLEASEFAHDVGHRVYTEWCMEEEANKRAPEHQCYNGEAYTKFLDDEIYFHLERRAKLLGHDTLCENHAEYLKERARVVRALVRRAAALLVSDGEKINGWKLNLRASLEEWIE